MGSDLAEQLRNTAVLFDKRDPFEAHVQQKLEQAADALKAKDREIERLRSIEGAAIELREAMTVRPFDPHSTEASVRIRAMDALNRFVAALEDKGDGEAKDREIADLTSDLVQLKLNAKRDHREIERLRADRQTLVLMGAQSSHAKVIEILNDWIENVYAALEDKGDG